MQRMCSLHTIFSDSLWWMMWNLLKNSRRILILLVRVCSCTWPLRTHTQSWIIHYWDNGAVGFELENAGVRNICWKYYYYYSFHFLFVCHDMMDRSSFDADSRWTSKFCRLPLDSGGWRWWWCNQVYWPIIDDSIYMQFVALHNANGHSAFSLSSFGWKCAMCVCVAMAAARDSWDVRQSSRKFFAQLSFRFNTILLVCSMNVRTIPHIISSHNSPFANSAQFKGRKWWWFQLCRVSRLRRSIALPAIFELQMHSEHTFESVQLHASVSVTILCEKVHTTE